MSVRTQYQALRVIKSKEEVTRLKYASWLTDQSMDALGRELGPGILADRLPALVEPSYLQRGGYTGIHYFGVMSMAGPYLAAPAQYLAPHPLKVGDVITTEITGCYGGYPSQAHRTYSLGASPDRSWQRLHDSAREAFYRLLATVRAGAVVEDLMDSVEFVHRQGLTVLDDLVHGADQLPPVLQSRSTVRQPYPENLVLQENMVLVLQPNLVDEEGRGLQFGETVRVTADGVERLNHLADDWVVVSGT